MARFPSTSANRLASSPSRNSSITIGPSPAARIAASASARVMATVTPLPAASPSALITTGIEKRSSAAIALGLGLDPDIAGGRDSGAGAKILGEALGAFELGRGGTWPEGRDSGCAGRIGDARDQRRFGADDDQVDARAPWPGRPRHADRRDRSRRIPPSAQCRDCPGAAISASQLGDCLNRHASASSRPPEPSSRMFMPLPDDLDAHRPPSRAEGRRQCARAVGQRAVGGA